MTIAKKLTSWQRHVVDHARAGFGNAEADLLRFDDAAEFGLDRLLALGGDQPDAHRSAAGRT